MLEVVGRPVDRDLIRLPAQRSAKGRRFVARELARVGDIRRFDITFLVAQEDRKLAEEIVAEGYVHRRLELCQTKIAGFQVHIRIELFAGLDRVDQNRPADGIAPEQRPLGPSQHLYRLNVDDLG